MAFRSLESRLFAAFLVAACLLLGAVAFAFMQAAAYIQADRRLDDLRDIDLAATRFDLSLRNAESRQRGVLLTGRDTDLLPYEQAVAEMQQRFAMLGAAANTDPASAATVAGMRASMDVLLQDLARAVAARRAAGPEAVSATMSENPGGDAMRPVHEASDALHATLTARSGAATASTRAQFDRATVGLGVAAVLLITALGIATCAIGMAITARRRLAFEVERAANHDALTGLPNRRFFNDWLAYALAQAQRDETTLGLMVIDLDGFKALNDRDGHEAGDALLVDVARRFGDVKRDSDVLARVGGDEFVLAATGDVGVRDMEALASRLLAALGPAAPRPDTGVGASVGVAFFPSDASDLQSLIAAADAAMYAAKRAGKNRVAFHASPQLS